MEGRCGEAGYATNTPPVSPLDKQKTERVLTWLATGWHKGSRKTQG